MQVTESDAQLQLKKRARRRLVGAVAFVAFAAIVLPLVCLLFAYLAARAIFRDELLVRAADRIR